MSTITQLAVSSVLIEHLTWAPAWHIVAVVLAPCINTLTCFVTSWMKVKVTRCQTCDSWQ